MAGWVVVGCLRLTAPGMAVLGVGTEVRVLRSDVVVEAQLAYMCSWNYVEACSENQAMQKAVAMAKHR